MDKWTAQGLDPDSSSSIFNLVFLLRAYVKQKIGTVWNGVTNHLWTPWSCMFFFLQVEQRDRIDLREDQVLFDADSVQGLHWPAVFTHCVRCCFWGGYPYFPYQTSFKSGQ